MAIKYEEKDNVGFVTFDADDSKVNVLDSQTIKEFDSVLNDIKTKLKLKALVIQSAKKDIFIAGADIKEIEKIVDPKDGANKAKAGQDLFNKLEDLAIPTIAVVDGAALGGGCELILACNYRIATFNKRIKIGLPEVNLGFVPGFGGTYRLPRLVGLQQGLKLILSGKPLSSSRALRIGLVDKIVMQKILKASVESFIADVLSKKSVVDNRPRKKPRGFNSFLEESITGQYIVFSQSRKSVLKLSKGFYPAPLKAVDVIQSNYFCNREKGLKIEREAFGKLAVTLISKNLVNLFYISEKYKKLSVKNLNGKPVSIEQSAVLGAGIMGGGIAQLFASRDIWSRLKDLNYDAIAQGYRSANAVFKKAVKKRRLTKSQAQMKMAHITGTLDYSGFSHVDLVVEAVVEDIGIKKSVFKELSNVVSEDTVLATNTSALSVTEIAKEIKVPSRVIGIHFFNPVHMMPLVEIITTEETSDQTIASTLKLVQRLGKIPIVVKDSCGFIVNRILLGYINEGGRILEECGQLERIDKLMTSFGMPMGPFLLSDEVGLDVGNKVLKILEEGLGERFKPVEIYQKVYEKKLLGKKTGKGFYVHESKPQVNAQIAPLLSTRKMGDFKSQEFLERMIYIMINEAAMCLQEGIVDHPDAIDVGMIFGTGFPPFRGGLLRYADSVGLEKIVERLKALTDQFQSQRFKPAPFLLDLASKQKGFYQE